MTKTMVGGPDPDDEGHDSDDEVRPDLYLVDDDQDWLVEPELGAVIDDIEDMDDHPGVDVYAVRSRTEPARAYELVDGAVPEAANVKVAYEGPRRAPTVPAWLRTRAGRRAMVDQWRASAGSTMVFHGVRLPLYAGRVMGRCPQGLLRIVRWVAHWCGDHGEDEARGELRATVAVTRSSALQVRSLEMTRSHHQMIAVRWTVVLLVLGVWGYLVYDRLGDLALWQQAVAGFASVFVLGAVGSIGVESRQPVISTVVYAGSRPLRPDPELVTAWLAVLGHGTLASAIKADPENAIRYLGPAQRHGAGWQIEMDLPAGVTADDVVQRRSRLAGAMRSPRSCVWPTAAPEVHEARLVLYVADQPMSAGGVLPWALKSRGTVNLFRPIPIGVDHRGEPIEILLMFASGVIGSIPRMGKTWLVRLIGLAGALDHRCDIYAYDLKGTGDLQPLEERCVSHVCGEEPEHLKQAVEDMRGLRREMRRRAKVIRELPNDVCPENKVTDELASRRDLGLHPILLLVDECQKWFEDPTHGDELVEIAEDLVRRGPALGIMAWFATQRPDVKSIPAGIRDNAVIRFCLKVTTWKVSDMVLNDPTIRANTLSRGDLGVAIMAGEGDDPKIVKTAGLDAVESRQVVERAVALRRSAGWEILTGLDDLPPALSMLERVSLVWEPGRTGMTWVELAAAIEARWPGELGIADTDRAALAVSAATPVASTNVRVGGKVLKGCKRDAIEGALNAITTGAKRNEEGGATESDEGGAPGGEGSNDDPRGASHGSDDDTDYLDGGPEW